MDGLSFTDTTIDAHGGGGGGGEGDISLLRVNWYFPYFQGQKNEIFSTRGGMSVNISLRIRITCGMPRCNGSEGSEIHTR